MYYLSESINYVRFASVRQDSNISSILSTDCFFNFLDGPGCLATRPSHVLQTAFRCIKKFLQIISVKITEEVFSFS